MGTRPLAVSRPLLLRQQQRLRGAPPGMAAMAAAMAAPQRGGPGAGPAEPINALARISAASCSGSAEVSACAAGRERSGVPPAPSLGVGRVSVRARRPGQRRALWPPRSRWASGPAARAPQRAPAALSPSSPGAPRALAGGADDSFPVRAAVLTIAVQARTAEPRAPAGAPCPEPGRRWGHFPGVRRQARASAGARRALKAKVGS